MKRPVCIPILLASFLLFLNATNDPNSYAIGDIAEDFRLQNVDGKMVSLSDFPDAKGFIIVFTCNHCPYAQIYEQRIINLHKKFNPKGFPVIAINPNDAEIVPDDSFDEMVRRAAAKRYPFVYLHDADQTVYPKFGANRTPHVFVLNKDKVVRYIGAIDDNPETPSAVRKKYVENAVEAVLRDERPNPDLTRAIGCPIKRKRH
ncbi:MAG: thioredoxin family protein [Lewinellaceae bacterium]|nr:thioredoxin family protein [Saprospiraceae bacterium]MCB9317145.1 thioredoxin family protein [Lewinellaceae bacterium]MCB9332736.1 thioredoxin family protein [Lewinellaceae bacterium]